MRNYAPQLLKAYSLATGVFTPEIIPEEFAYLQSKGKIPEAQEAFDS